MVFSRDEPLKQHAKTRSVYFTSRSYRVTLSNFVCVHVSVSCVMHLELRMCTIYGIY